MKTFLERLQKVLVDRKLNPWLVKLGSDTGMGGRIKTGTVPNDSLLGIISRAENVSLTWLLEGRGNPYIVNIAERDQEACKLIGIMLSNEPSWSATLVDDGSRYAVILSQPGQYLYKESWLPYTIVEVIAGWVGSTAIDAANVAHEKRYLSVSKDEMFRLQSGEIGTYELFGDANRKGIMGRADKVDGFGRISLKVAESQSLYSTEEQIVLDHFRSMCPEQRDAYKKVGAALAQQGVDKKSAV